MRFTCEGKQYDTEQFSRIYTGDPRVPLVLVMRGGVGRNGQRVLVVEKGTPPELIVRVASKAEIQQLRLPQFIY
jgi:Ni,Fe-hydrogenase III small subunit